MINMFIHRFPDSFPIKLRTMIASLKYAIEIATMTEWQRSKFFLIDQHFFLCKEEYIDVSFFLE